MDQQKVAHSCLFFYRSRIKATASPACETVWLRRILRYLQLKQVQAIKLHCGNQSLSKSTKNPVYHACMKHNGVHNHFIRELVQTNEVKLVYCSTREHNADIFSKVLGQDKFENFRIFLNIKTNIMTNNKGCWS